LTFPSPSGNSLVQAACLSHWDKHNLSQSACSTATGCACPSCLSKWDGFGTGTTLPKSVLDQVYGHSLSKTKGVLNKFRKFLIKNRYQIDHKSTLKIDFFHFFNSKLNPLPTQGSRASSKRVCCEQTAGAGSALAGLVLQVWCCRRIGVVWIIDTSKLSCVLLSTFSTWSIQRICLLNPCQPKK